MEDNSKPVHLETDSARGGMTPHVVRYVLGFSMAGAIIGMALGWWIWHGSH